MTGVDAHQWQHSLQCGCLSFRAARGTCATRISSTPPERTTLLSACQACVLRCLNYVDEDENLNSGEALSNSLGKDVNETAKQTDNGALSWRCAPYRLTLHDTPGEERCPPAGGPGSCG